MDLREKRENFSLIKLLAKFSEPVLKWEKRHEWRTFKSYSFQDHLRVKFIHVIRKVRSGELLISLSCKVVIIRISPVIAKTQCFYTTKLW
ncbi:uncharacterized protein LOC105435935 isoform X3 [Cucumis sativus]|uniref:uncharacterized protein LOC105435935 isoform X3 n=1 Tax=Cucumis sativus TaxID=3659 RepID=UPI0012F4A6D0|nr:uncharacterized protein LOC105435935 isoform X3 [Cucumis sativus]